MATDLSELPAGSDTLQDLTPAGSAVKSRISDPKQAIEICNRFLRDDMIRAERRVRVQGLIDGNVPISQKRMEKAGRGEDSNLNWREAKGQILNAWTPYFDLVCEVPVCAEGELEYGDADQDAELVRGFIEYFHDMVFSWTGFDRTTQLRDWEMLIHGIGVWAWENEWDWRPEVILSGNGYVTDDTYSDLSNAEMFMITKNITVSELWGKIWKQGMADSESEKQARAAGWNPDAVKRCIMTSTRSDSYMLAWKWDRWQQALKNGDIYVAQMQTKQIKLCYLYVKEMSGKISQHIIQYYGTTVANPNDYLYSYLNRYKSWEECICPFAYDVGSDGTWHSVKGLGTEIFPYCQLSNKVKNSLCDLVLVGMKPMFQPTTGNDAQRMQMIKMGGFNIVPPNFSPLAIDVSKGLQPALAFSREMQSTLFANTGSYQQNDSDPNAVEQTAKEATIKALDQAKLSKGAHNRHYRSMDRAYANMWARAVNPNLMDYHPGAMEALEFQDKCKALCRKMGVDESALQHVKNVRAMRSMGFGSAAFRIEIANAIMQQYPNLDPVGQNHALRIYFSSIMSYANIDALVPNITTGQIPTEDDSIAVLENNALATGGQAQITPRQNHVIHLNRHIGSMEQDVQSLQQGAPMQQIFQSLEAKGMHSHEHLDIISKNPTRKRETDGFNRRLQALAAIQDKLQQNIAEQQQAQPPPKQPDPELVKVQGNLTLKQQKQQAEITLRQQKLNAEIANMAKKTQADIQLKYAATGEDINRKTRASQQPAAV